MNATEKFFRPSQYFRPATLKEALELAKNYGAKAQVVAGATDVLVDQKPGVEALIDITGLGLNHVRKGEQGGLVIGAAATMAELAGSPHLKNNGYHIIADAASQLGTPQVRNAATIGGNLCSALPSSDMAPPLLALDAEVRLVSLESSRIVPIEQFFLSVRKADIREDEIMTEILLPPSKPGEKTWFSKMERLSTGDLALVNAALRVTLAADGTCSEARIAFGAVAPTPLRAKTAEALLAGSRVDDSVIAKAAAAAAEETKPISDVRASREYRKHICRVFVERCLHILKG